MYILTGPFGCSCLATENDVKESCSSFFYDFLCTDKNCFFPLFVVSVENELLLWF